MGKATKSPVDKFVKNTKRATRQPYVCMNREAQYDLGVALRAANPVLR